MRTIERGGRMAMGIVVLLAAAGCEPEDEPEEQDERFVAGVGTLLTDEAPIYPGPRIAERLVRTENPFEGDDQALRDGERLWSWMNCNGCHGTRGGGGIAPPMADGTMIYGRDPAMIFQSIVQGRPQGMPAFGGMLPERNVWELVTYIQAILRDELPRARVPEEPEIRVAEWEDGMLDARRLAPQLERAPQEEEEEEEEEGEEAEAEEAGRENASGSDGSRLGQPGGGAFR